MSRPNADTTGMIAAAPLGRAVGSVRVVRHWHVTERSGRARVFVPRMRVVATMGADSAQAAFGAFSRRANELMLDGWQLDVYGSDDRTITVLREKETRVVEVYECYEAECLAGRPAPGLGGMAIAQ